MKILVINSGSSSIKYKFFEAKTSRPLCRGFVERIGSDSSILTHQTLGRKPVIVEVNAPDHTKAIRYIFDMLVHSTSGVISSYREISGIGHRVVHGSDIFTEPTIINDKVIKAIERFNELAPLHNPPALLGIRACARFAKKIPQVAVFDTSFYNTVPEKAFIYGIPFELYKSLKIRRFGFHGTSHKFVAKQAAKSLNKDLSKLKLVTCHLGNGCSATAINHGRAIDTSMGFTPLEGLLMGTRCGDIDAAAVLFIMEKKGLNIKGVDKLLNKESGLLGLSGVSNDMRDVLKAANTGNKRAKLAIELFLYRLKKYIGAYAASMDGLDAVVLTAGIGENLPLIKNRISKELHNFLYRFRAKLLVIPTDEELMISHETAEVLSKKGK
ncbi:acetate/propionate family kinase [Candidatus Omnitrophota bacterium]